MKLIKLEQPNCNPCKMVTNYLNEKEVNFDSINVMDNPDVASDYGVMSVPVTILLDSNNNEIQRVNGFKPNELDEMVSQLNT